MLLRKICCHPYLLSYPLSHELEYKIDEKLVKSSGKLMMLDIMLSELKKRGHKVLIFSQFVCMLEILQDYCFLRGHKYNILYGSMRLSNREKEISEFNNDPNSFLFLISTKAGGLGINLIAADTVIIYDSDWNPQSDLQAQDRCHRIGQDKPVIVYRLVIPNTVDEYMVSTADSKRKLEKAIIKKGRFASKDFLNRATGRLTIEEMIEILESSDVTKFKEFDENNIIS
ncbi:Lymphocyte-specific helicase, partial [Stegodyphus mimosarum]